MFLWCIYMLFFFFFKQKTAYEMRISDWSSDVCSSDLRSHGGTQGVYKHASTTTGTDMSFAVFVPDHADGAKLPVLWYLSGLTCTHANGMAKGEYRAACAEHGVLFIAPDTSPRGEGVPDGPDAAYGFGGGAGYHAGAHGEPGANNE